MLILATGGPSLLDIGKALLVIVLYYGAWAAYLGGGLYGLWRLGRLVVSRWLP